MARQPGTGLDRATKSIPLSGGITEEVDDLLLEPGGMQYMENLRFTKKDVAEKARSRGTGIPTTVTNHADGTYGLWAQGDSVAVVGHERLGISRDGGDTFETHTGPYDLMGIERILSTAEASGGNNYSWAPVMSYTAGSPDTYTLYGYVVAFERITQVTGTHTNTREVIVQIYDLAGRVLEETIIAGAGAPKVGPCDGRTIVSLVKTTGYVFTYEVTTGGMTLTAVNNTDRLVTDVCQDYNQVDPGYGNAAAPQDWNEMRLGYAKDLMENNYAFDSFNEYTSAFGVQGWKDTAGVIKVVRTSNGAPTGTVKTIQTDSGTLFGKILDVSSDATYIYVLYSQTRNAPGGTSDLYCARMNVDTTSLTTKTLETTQDVTYINGSIRPTGDASHYIALTIAQGEPNDMQYVTQGGHRVHWYQLASNFSTVSDEGDLYSHRLCSDLAVDRAYKPHACVQQWDNWNPGSGGTSPLATLDDPGFTPTHKKPVTTALIALNSTLHENRLVATFDAGQSKSCLAGSDEQSIHMSGELYYFTGPSVGDDAHVFWYGNRVLLGATDDFYQMITDPSLKLHPSSDGRAALHPGSSRFSCYKLASEIQVNSVNFTTGMFMGTALPAWYDGSTTLCSMQPIDSPEIISWFDATDGGSDMGSYGAYQDLSASYTAHEAKVINLVCGYYDDSGLVHRSAPSLDYYIGKMKSDDTAGTHIQVWFTPPIGLTRDRSYFVEAYEAFPGGVPQLAATKQISTNDGSSKQSIDWATNLFPSTSPATGTDVTDFRASKTIYTAGNVLAADPWPNFDLVVRSGRRLFAHSISDPSTIYYSKTFESGVAPEFSASLTVSLGNEVITAMGAIDDKVILFSDKGCWNMYGTGPDNTGAQGDFFVEQMVFPVGCTDQQSIVTMENGIAFYSNSTEEFHILTRNLELVDIGEAVKVISESITDVVTSIVVPGDHEIRWYCTRTVGPEYVADSATNSPPQPPRPFIENQAPAGSVFVYNYKYQKWSIFEDAAVRTEKVVMIGNTVAELADDYDLYKESTTSWDKLCKWETPWIKVNQLQDFGRFYGLTFLGKYMSSWDGSPLQAGDLQVTIRYDYEGPLGATDVHRERANVDFDPADGDRLQFRVRPKRQKCQAIKIEIEEVATTAVELWEPTYTTGQGFILTGVDVHYGAKGGSGDKSLGAARRKG